MYIIVLRRSLNDDDHIKKKIHGRCGINKSLVIKNDQIINTETEKETLY